MLSITFLYNNRYSIMDCRTVFLFWMAVLLALLVTSTEGRTKKIVIHVPYKVQKLKHTHTVYKTVHHHHTHRDPHIDHGLSEEHEHFHHMHKHTESPSGQHSKPIPEIGIPEFLPNGALDGSLEMPDIPTDVPSMPNRHGIPFYRRN